jgi:phosphoadenosine phosphosulfate reductase
MGRSRSSSSGESGYVSGSHSESALPLVVFTNPQLRHINKQLQHASPRDILKWSLQTLPNLYQTTAFGLTGLVTLDMLSKLHKAEPHLPRIELVFYDTLYSFPETLALLDRIRARYPEFTLHVYKPRGCETAADFEAKYGAKLWETDDARYDALAKVEPADRAAAELNIGATFTGRRRTQGAARNEIDIVEVDDKGLVKVNPLLNWSFKEVWDYVKANDVPYNELVDRGYKSIGDWHSTQPVKEGESERAGRWKGQDKTECGIHNKRSKYAIYLEELARKEQEEAAKAQASVEVTA